MEILLIVSLVLSIVSGFILSFIGGYAFGKFKAEKEKDEEIKRINKRRIMNYQL